MVRCTICGELTEPSAEHPEEPVECSLRCFDERQERERVADLRIDAARQEHRVLPNYGPYGDDS